MGPCLLWTGSKTGSGYGQIILTGTKKGPRDYVHRIVWAATNGEIPAGHEIHHRCEVTLCAREPHLECVTHRENMLATPHNAAAANAARTACSSCDGPFDAIDSRGKRFCRRCKNRHEAERRAKKRASGFVQDPKTRLWVR